MSYNKGMTEANRGDIEADRDSDGRFMEGREKTGGKKAGKTFATRAREAMEAAETPESFGELTKLLWGIVRMGKDDKLRMDAAKLLKEWGAGPEVTKIAVTAWTDEELEEHRLAVSASFANR
jgi:hypothetical protein